MPVASPSSPSMRLTALVMTMTHNAVRGRHVGGQHGEADEGDLELEHGHAQEDEHHGGQHLPGHLGRSRHLPHVVDEPHLKMTPAPSTSPSGSDDPANSPCSWPSCDATTTPPGRPGTWRCRPRRAVTLAWTLELVGLHHEMDPGGQVADREHRREGAHRGHRRHHQVCPERGHDLSGPRSGCARRPRRAGGTEGTRRTARAPHRGPRATPTRRRAGAGHRPSTPRARHLPGPIPAVVWAAVPSRSPEVTKGERGSPGMVLRLRVIPARSRTSWACLPVSSASKGRRSIRIRWLSVPPETSRNPSAARARARAAALATTLAA